MSLEIKTNVIEPARKSYGFLARRFGQDKTASRYEEVSYDLQPTVNFHYKPIWRPEFDIYDERLTAVKMADWDALRDPRQFYYGAYNLSRAAMIDGAQKNLKLVDELGMLNQITPDWREKCLRYIGPMRHVEWGANMNNYEVCAEGYGVAVTAPASFCAHDRLGMAQLISELLLLFEPTGHEIEKAKEAWLAHGAWQGVRKMVEDSFVVKDWFELFVAQNFSMDAVLHPLCFDHFDEAGRGQGAAGVSLITQFMRDWRKDNTRWVDAVLKVAAKESPENAALISGWAKAWMERSLDAARPLAEEILGADAEVALKSIADDIAARAKKIGLEI